MYPTKEQIDQRVKQVEEQLQVLYKQKLSLINQISYLEQEQVVLSNLKELRQNVIQNN